MNEAEAQLEATRSIASITSEPSAGPPARVERTPRRPKPVTPARVHVTVLEPANDDAALEFAAMICTEKQMEVLYLRAKGMGVRQIARRLLISNSAARERLDSADLRLRRAITEKGVA